MSQLRIARLVVERLQIREPLEFIRTQAQPIGEIAQSFDRPAAPILAPHPPAACAAARRSIRKSEFRADISSALAENPRLPEKSERLRDALAAYLARIS